VDLLWGMTVNGSNGRTAPRLSIVVPAAGEAAALEETLVSVLENRPADCEIIVVHGCDYADPWSIGDEVRLVRAPRRATVVGCTNLGIATATGRVIHVLAAGWRATDGWADGPVDLIDAGRADVVVPLAVAADDRDRVVSAGIRVAAGGRRMSVAPTAVGARAAAPELEAGFWSAHLLGEIGGGFATACGTDLADADAAAAVAAARGAVVLEPTSRVIVGPPRRRSGPFLAGMHAERLFWRSLAATPLLPALALHAVEWLRHMAASAPLGTVPMLAGRLAALVQLGSCVPRAMQLRGLRRRAGTAGKRLDSDRERTIRIDAPHERPAEPRRSEPGEPTVPLRRSA
jgi:hypothetical protein